MKLFNFSLVLLFAFIASVNCASIIFCASSDNNLNGEYPTHDCGSKLGWQNYYTDGDNNIVPGIWMRSKLSASERKSFGRCCEASGKHAYYNNDVSETAWKSLARASGWTSEAGILVVTILGGLFQCNITGTC